MKAGKSVWYSNRIEISNATIPSFDTPKEIITRFNYFSVMPATSRGFTEIMKHGEDVNKTWTVIANSNAFDGMFKEGDVFWVDGHKPIPEIEEEYGNGSSANAVVDDVAYVNSIISITLKKNKKQIKE